MENIIVPLDPNRILIGEQLNDARLKMQKLKEESRALKAKISYGKTERQKQRTRMKKERDIQIAKELEIINVIKELIFKYKKLGKTEKLSMEIITQIKDLLKAKTGEENGERTDTKDN